MSPGGIPAHRTSHMPKLRSRAAGMGTDLVDIPKELEPILSAGSEVIASTISRRAYELWLERGCPEGSPEEDWFKAEAEIKHRARSSESDASGDA